jgi:hypothetical protein
MDLVCFNCREYENEDRLVRTGTYILLTPHSPVIEILENTLSLGQNSSQHVTNDAVKGWMMLQRYAR